MLKNQGVDFFQYLRFLFKRIARNLDIVSFYLLSSLLLRYCEKMNVLGICISKLKARSIPLLMRMIHATNNFFFRHLSKIENKYNSLNFNIIFRYKMGHFEQTGFLENLSYNYYYNHEPEHKLVDNISIFLSQNLEFMKVVKKIESDW